MKTYSIYNALTRAIILAIVGVSLTANAGSYSETRVSTAADGLRSVSVSYADLNLASTAGRETLQQRISHAARRVCGSANLRQAGSLRQLSDNRKCQQRAIEKALKQMSERKFAAVAE